MIFTQEHYHTKTLSNNGMEFLICVDMYHLFHMFQYEILEGKGKQITMEAYRKGYQKGVVKGVKPSSGEPLRLSSAYPRQSR